ncbi:hypothetical protein [Hydrogenophaga sp. PAMC20947]|uniref:hypothetical protein n=1 Tax=Hydrogenophaga sp. PAMC20947 TaxID=2565558 RepID=UPI00109DA260|nr:hypothetical protein [Hydrogenophaga sp. PAMC20947]QCB47235.1 hypothetical protein E5678_15095 [Hydrogenophaga sp. PAMC20947]
MFSRFFKGQSPKQAEKGGAKAHSADQFTARVKHLAFVQALEQNGVPPDQMPLTRPLCGELLEAYAFDTSDQFVFATPALMKEAGIKVSDAEDLALHNLQQEIKRHGLRIIEDNGSHMLRVGPEEAETHLDAACLLSEGIWNLLIERTEPKGELLLMAPTRDFLMAMDSAKPETHANAFAFAKHVMGLESVHALSLQLMIRRPDGFKVWHQD